MHVRSWEKERIRIPFFVGEDRSRTWVLTQRSDRIMLKHDHRHKDGTPDAVTMYGGLTTSVGMPARQMFPADQETVNTIPAAATNVWWIDLVPGEHFTYNLRRMGSERYFSIKFDLKRLPLRKRPGDGRTEVIVELKVVLILIMLLTFPVAGQTASEIEKSFGKPVLAYSVTERIWMTPDFAADGQVCRMRFHPNV